MNRIDLIAYGKNGKVEKTGAKPKLPIKISGVQEQNLYVYKIPLEYLYYNDENGRIATSMSRVRKQLQPTYDFIDSSYNNQLEKMIESGNKTALNKTKKSIEKDSQQVFGYVLNDGRIIDGNRRFTALRQLMRETGRTYYFEAVVLPLDYDSKISRSEIKRLELAIQMGIEERESYDPVDLALDAYQTIELDELLTIKDYSSDSNIKPKEIEHRINTVKLMREFLAFINANIYAYEIIKDGNLYNPIYELSKSLSRNFKKEGPEKEEAKESSFTIIIRMLATGGDMVREIRDYFKTILTTENNVEFIEETEEPREKLIDSLESSNINSVTDLRVVIEDNMETIRKINMTYNSYKNKANREKDTDSFIMEIDKTKNLLEEMNLNGGLVGQLKFSLLDNKQIEDIRNDLIKINIATRKLIDIYETKE